MKTIKENLRIIVAIILVLVGTIPSIYNLNHPEITQAQLLLKFWWLYILVIGGVLLCLKDWK